MMGFARRFMAALRRELAHLARDRWDLAMLTLFPAGAITVVAAMLFAAVPRGLPVAVLDESNGAVSRAIIRAVMASPAVTITARPTTMAEAERLARAGQVWAILSLPDGMDKGLTRHDTPAIQIFYNASFLSIGGSAESALRSAVSAVLAEKGLDAARTRGLPAVRIVPPKVQATVLFNPQASFEWYLQALIQPAVLHLLTACVVVMAMGRELAGKSLAAWKAETGGGLAALLGKLAPYLAALTFWGAVWLIWLTGVRGWTMNGSLLLTLFAQALLFTGTAAISLLLVIGGRKASTAFSVSAVYAGSSLAYSGGTLPLDGGSGFARNWSAVLPFTHYLRLQMDQFLGAPVSVALPQLGVLSLYFVVPMALVLLLLRRPEKEGA